MSERNPQLAPSKDEATDAAQESANKENGTIKKSAAGSSKATAVDEIPNGGLTAWLQVVGSFFLFFSSWGLINAFGAFQTFYDTGELFKSTSSSISWIGTVQGFLLVATSGFIGVLFDKGYFRLLIYTGTFMVVFGTMMTSISTTYYQVFLAQAVCSGFGQGFLFVPSVAILSPYFSTHRALATGIGAAGSSVGGIILPIVFHRLQTTIGFGWATRALAFISLGTLAISLAIMKQRVLPKTTRSWVDLSAFRIPAFTSFLFGFFWIFIGLYIPFFYMTSYAALVLHTSEDIAFYMIAILNASSAFGRIILNYIADEVGPLNTFIPCSIISGILCFVWIGIRSSLAGLIVLSVIYGFFSGACVSLPPTIIANLTPDLSKIGTRMGMCFTISAFGLLIGNPIAGSLLNLKEAHFVKAQAFGGATLLGGSLFMIAARYFAGRGSDSWKH